MAFKFDGTNPLIHDLVDYVNKINKSGKTVPVTLEVSGDNISILSTANQQLIINSQVNSMSPGVVAEWVDASPLPKKPKGNKGESFARRKAKGEIVTTPYEKYRFLHTIVFIPNTDSKRTVSKVISDETTAVMSYAGYGDAPLGTYYRRWGWTAVEKTQRTWISHGSYENVRLAFLDKYRPGRDVYIGSPDGHKSWLYHIESSRVRKFTLRYGEMHTSLDGIVRPKGFGPATLSFDYSLPINTPPVIMPPSHDFWRSCHVEDPDQIVECYQRLDQAEMDFLTTVAEMQSSVEGIASNLIRTYTWARDMIRHARKFQFKEAITSAHIDNVFVGSKRAYDKMLRKADRDLANSRKRLSKKYQHSATGATDRLTSHWLDAQYGILPTMLTISDLIDTLNRKRFEFERRKVTVNTTLDFPETLGQYHLIRNNSKLRRIVWGKMKLDFSKNTLFNSFRQYGKLNPALTAWELVPLSFVVDWFTGIGDKLSTLDISPLYEKVFMTSFKAEVDVTYELETPSGKFVYRITGSGYRRKYTDTNQRFIINLKGITRFEHFVTSFSLLWQRAKGNKLPKGISNG